MLTRIYVDNYRCLVNFECRLGPRQLILGPNGAGKSTLFDVLTLLRDFCVRGEPADAIFVGPFRTRWQSVPVQTFELDVEGNEGTYKLRLEIDTWGNPARPRVVKETLDFSGVCIFRFGDGDVSLFNDKLDGVSRVQYPFDWHRSALATVSERADNTKLSWFKRWLGRTLVVSPDPHRMSGIAAREVTSPDQYLSNFACWYRHLKLAEDDRAYVADLGELIEGFDTIRLEDVGEHNREIMVRMANSENGKRGKHGIDYRLRELSDGQRVLIGLYAVLHFALHSGSTVCFDEPDNFIALREIQPWLMKVVERTEDEDSPAQVLIASHHPELLNRMAFDEGLLLYRPGGRHTRVRPFDDPEHTGLSASEIIARGWEHE